jgi:hypothetical protein
MLFPAKYVSCKTHHLRSITLIALSLLWGDYRLGVDWQMYWSLIPDNSLPIQSLCNSLRHALSLLSQLYLNQSSGNGFQRWTIPFLSVLEMSPCLSHSNCILTSSQQLSFHSRLNLYTPFKKAVISQTELMFSLHGPPENTVPLFF